MRRLATILCSLLLAVVSVTAQERHAEVKVADGRVLTGRVLLMDVEQLELEVGNDVVRIPAADLRSCRFFVADDPATAAAVASSDPAGDDAKAEDDPSPDGASKKYEPNISWTGPLPDPVDPTSPQAVPVDLRNRSLWQSRIQVVDEAFPWLQPGASSQWISLGLLLFVGLGLIVHLSVSVSGAEAPQLARSMSLGVWYLVTGLAQVAFVRVNDLSVGVMILANTSLSLFALCALFGLQRWNAMVALMIQLGFGVLVYGILELVTALLGSCGVTL